MKTKTKIITAEIDQLYLGFEMDYRCTLTVARLYFKPNAQHTHWAHDCANTFNLPAATTENRAEDLASRLAGLLWLFEKASLDVTGLRGVVVRVKLEVMPGGAARVVGVGHITAERWLEEGNKSYPLCSGDWQNALRPYQTL